jgi:hypothetical protein
MLSLPGYSLSDRQLSTGRSDSWAYRLGSVVRGVGRSKEFTERILQPFREGTSARIAAMLVDEAPVFSDYYAAFRDSPWLRRLFKLEVIRLSSIARQPVTAKSETILLLCVDRVRDLELLDPSPKNRRLRIRLELDVSEVGAWSGEIPVLVLNEEALRECRARVAASHRLFQPTVVIPGM